MKKVSKKQKRERRHARIRARVFGTHDMPRLSVFKSNTYISAQLIDDTVGTTLASSHSTAVTGATLLARSAMVGHDIAKKAIAQKITRIVFDRGGYMYTGCVAALADGARKEGLQF